MTTALVVLLVAAGAVAQSLSGIGFGLVCGPALVAALGPADGVRTSVLLSFVVNLAVLAREHRHVDWRGASGLLVPAAVATPLWAVALRRVPDRAAEALAGLAAVVGAALIASGLRWRAARGRLGMLGAAVASAAMNTAAGIGGPAVALWADNAGWSHDTVRGTLQVYFLGLNGVAVVALGLPDQGPGQYGGQLAALVAGLLVGAALRRRVPTSRARQLTLALAATGGLAVLLRAALP